MVFHFINKVGYLIFGWTKNSWEVQWIYLDWIKGCLNWLKVIQFRSWHWISWFRAISHVTQEPWPWNCESPKKCPKAVPRQLPRPCSVAMDPQCSVKLYATEPSTKCYSDDFLFNHNFFNSKSRQEMQQRETAQDQHPSFNFSRSWQYYMVDWACSNNANKMGNI